MTRLMLLHLCMVTSPNLFLIMQFGHCYISVALFQVFKGAHEFCTLIYILLDLE